MHDANMPDATVLEAEIRRRWRVAEEAGADYIDLQAGVLHRHVGGYPGRNHRMRDCCHVMHRMMVAGDEVLASPKSGQGATVVIRYRLPRLRDYSTERV